MRFTLSEAARCEVLDRLLALNHERHAEELRQGLHPKADAEAGPATKKPARPSAKPPKSAHSKPAPKPEQLGLGFAAPSAPPLDPPAKALLRVLQRRKTPAPKADLLTAAGLDDADWPKAIRQLKDAGLVTQTCEKRAAEYAWSGHDHR